VLEPIVLDWDAGLAEVLDAMPASEQGCVVAAIGQARIDELAGGAEATDDESIAMLGCLGSESWVRILAGSLLGDGETLSPETATCMSERLSGVEGLDLAGLLSGDEAAMGMEVFGAISSFLPAIFCMNEEERTAFEGSDTFDTGGITLDQLECFFDALGPTGLSRLGALASGGVEEDVPPELLMELMPAVMGCGFDIMEALVPEGLPGGTPESEPESVPEGLPEVPEGVSPDDLPFSPEQLLCLSEELGEDPLEAIQSGAVSPLDMLDVISKCGIDLQSLAP